MPKGTLQDSCLKDTSGSRKSLLFAAQDRWVWVKQEPKDRDHRNETEKESTVGWRNGKSKGLASNHSLLTVEVYLTPNHLVSLIQVVECGSCNFGHSFA